MWQIWALNSAVCSGGAIFHRAQTWHLKCRSSRLERHCGNCRNLEILNSARNLVEASRVLGAETT